MNQQMKNRYRLFKRGWGVYYAFNNETGNSESLDTRDKEEATRLVHALNEAGRMTQLNMQIARAYLDASDPQITRRTWQYVVDEIIKLKTGTTQYRWQTVAKDAALTPKTTARHEPACFIRNFVSLDLYPRR